MDPRAFPPKVAASRENCAANDASKSAVDDHKCALFAANSKSVPSESAASESKNPDNRASCDDLLDLAGDRDEKKSNGKEKGTQSDEVRIMEKVLGPKVKSDYYLISFYDFGRILLRICGLYLFLVFSLTSIRL